MKIKKKYADECILFHVQTTPAKINFAKVLKVFDIKNAYVEIIDCVKKEPKFIDFLESQNINYSMKTKVGINLSATIADTGFESFFKNVPTIKFDELKIWNPNLSTSSNNNITTSFNSIFYINYSPSRADYFEIICDNTYDKEDLEAQLTNALTSEI